MKFVYSCQTDIGTTRAVNQDSLVIKSLNIKGCNVLMAAVCDGVGGLKYGEKTSRRAVEMLSQWFDYEIPQIMEHLQIKETMRYRCKQLIDDINKEIYFDDLRCGISSGTTISLLLLWNHQYLIGHVGDSRIYAIDQQVRQLTQDHSWVAREVELGHMTSAEAATDSHQNIILKCIGVKEEVEPDWFGGIVREPTTFLLCTDGFWHYLKPQDIEACFSPRVIKMEAELGANLCQMTERVKRKGETDNITVIAINIY